MFSKLNYSKFFTLTLALTLLFLQIYSVFFYPVWRDDSGFAQLAKNMINGEGYSAVMFDKLYPFSYLIATAGPTVVLPAAAAIFLFGNTYWAIGLANVFLIWSLIVVIFIAADAVLEKEKKWLFCFLALFFCLLFSSGNEGSFAVETKDSIALWHLLMGEIPAALCVIAGAFLLLPALTNWKKILAGGLFLGLAVMAKTITALAVATVSLIFALRVISDKKIIISKKIKFLTLAAAAVIAPIFFFEMAKILTLGWQAYREFQIDSAAFYKIIGAVENNALQRFSSLRAIFGVGYFYSLLSVVLISCFSLKRNSTSSLLAVTLFGCFVVHLIWWINFSMIGSYRHFITGLLYFCVALSLVLTNINYKNQLQVAITSFLIFFLVMGRLVLINYDFNFNFEKTDQLKEQLEIVEEVKLLEARGVTLFACGSNFELEYLLPGSRHFKDCLDMPKENNSAAMLVSYFINGNQVVAMRPEYPFTNVKVIPEEILNQCSQKYMDKGNFSLHWCK
ncbi:MAG: hypothetical protein V4694_00975 [Pseudomonadota bacterium]